MALNTRLSAPSYKIYEPDALDVALSNRVLDPLQGGIAGAMLLAHGVDNTNAQKQYLESSDKFNQMARGLDAMEIAQKHKEAAMKIGGTLVQHGEDPTNIQGMEDVFRNVNGSLLPGLLRSKIGAEIAGIGAKANADRNASMDTVQETYTDPGTGVTRTVTHKGKAGRIDIPDRGSVDPTASTPIPNANPATAKAATNQIIQRAAAAVGASDVSQLSGGKDAGGNYVIKNTASGKTATFDSSGKQLR